MSNLRRSCLSLVMAIWLCRAAVAGLVVADFNDISTGGLNGKAGGSGFSGTWYGSSSPQVVAGDLTYADYAITQSNTAQRIRSSSNTADRQDVRDLAAAQSGEVWFTVLVNVLTGTRHAGLTFNTYGNAYDPITTDLRVFMTTNQLQVGYNGGSANSTGSYAVDTTHLILGRMYVVGGDDSISVWVDPELNGVTGPSGLPAADYTSPATNFTDSITDVGAAGNGNSSGTNTFVDAIRVSDTATAFYDVTGCSPPNAGTLFVFQ